MDPTAGGSINYRLLKAHNKSGVKYKIHNFLFILHKNFVVRVK